jgi:hypothetical protein
MLNVSKQKRNNLDKMRLTGMQLNEEGSSDEDKASAFDAFNYSNESMAGPLI